MNLWVETKTIKKIVAALKILNNMDNGKPKNLTEIVSRLDPGSTVQQKQNQIILAF